jgi:uncharacterized protein with PIN domain
VKHELKIERCDDPSVKPKCPSCKNVLEKLLSIKVAGGFFSANQSNVVVCPHCHTMLGYGKVNYF